MNHNYRIEKSSNGWRLYEGQYMLDIYPTKKAATAEKNIRLAIDETNDILTEIGSNDHVRIRIEPTGKCEVWSTNQLPFRFSSFDTSMSVAFRLISYFRIKAEIEPKITMFAHAHIFEFTR